MPEIATETVSTRKKSAPAPWRSLSHRWKLAILIAAAGLIVLRVALPYVLKKYVNHQLDKAPGYAGSIGDVRVHLWRGAYQINDLKIVKTEGNVPAPLFAARKIDLSMEWKEIFHGALVGEIVLDEPEIHFVAGPDPQRTQTGKDRPWGKTLESLFPFKLNRLQINQGKIHFQNFDSTPPVNIFINEVSAIATNLTNTRDLTQPLPSGLSARGQTLGGGNVDLQLQMNPLANHPTFQITAQATNVNLVALNDFLRAYGKFDVERGTFALYSSFAVADGKYDGYAKVFFDNLDVFAWEKERKKKYFAGFLAGHRRDDEHRSSQSAERPAGYQNPDLRFIRRQGHWHLDGRGHLVAECFHPCAGAETGSDHHGRRG